MPRFSTTTTIYGYEVVDQDGRSVSGAYEYPNRPNDLADTLNAADADGPQALRRALGAAYEDDDAEFDAFVSDDDYDYDVAGLDYEIA